MFRPHVVTRRYVMHRIIGSFVALAVFTAGNLSTQQPGLGAGARVRIHMAGAAMPLTGTVAYLDPGSVAILRAPADTAFIPFTAISRVEVSAGRRSNIGRGAKWGALVGAGAGALLGLAAMSEDDGYFEFGAEAVPIGMLGGGVFGGAVGGLFGALTTSERWAPGAAAVALTAGGDRVGVSARLTF
jgi:hypothetical protein